MKQDAKLLKVANAVVIFQISTVLSLYIAGFVPENLFGFYIGRVDN
ncbi:MULTISPECIES: hypothetical protein [unclassified Acinetobacter]